MTTATLNDRRLSKANELRAFAKENESNWTAEVEEKWKRINGEYADLKGQQEAELKAAADAKARNDRLAQLDDDERKVFTNRLIGREGAGNDGATMDPHNLGSLQKRQLLALSGWIKGTGRGDTKPNKEEIEAALSLGQDVRDSEFKLGQLNLGEFRAIQEAGGYYNGVYRNTLTTQTGSSGGFTIGETFLARLERATLFYGGMLQAAEIIRTSSGEPMFWPTAKDTNNKGRILTESAPVAALDPSFGRIMWSAFKWTSDQILVPFELLQDSLFNLEPILVDMLGERIGRAQNEKFTTGVGGIEPRGIVAAATLGKTAASATAITYLELLDLFHSVDISRRTNGRWMFHDNLLLAFRKLVDSNGLPIWQPANLPLQSMMASGVPDTLNGAPYTVNNDMASAISTGAKTVLWGQLMQYKIRQVGVPRLMRLNELYAANDQVAFQAFVRADGNLLDAGDHPVKYLQQA